MRLTRARWIELALDMLAERGPPGLTVSRLCTAANKTKGSFYHHFPTHEHLLKAVIHRWAEKNTEHIISRTEDHHEPLRLLHHLTNELDFALEQAIRSLVARNPTLQPHLNQVDERRLTFLTQLLINKGVAPVEADHIATLEYAAYLGFQQLQFKPERLGELFVWFSATVAQRGSS